MTPDYEQWKQLSRFGLGARSIQRHSFGGCVSVSRAWSGVGGNQFRIFWREWKLLQLKTYWLHWLYRLLDTFRIHTSNHTNIAVSHIGTCLANGQKFRAIEHTISSGKRTGRQNIPKDCLFASWQRAFQVTKKNFQTTRRNSICVS